LIDFLSLADVEVYEEPTSLKNILEEPGGAGENLYFAI
jgi:hypothetical protein